MSDMGDDHPCPYCRGKDFNEETLEALREANAIAESKETAGMPMEEFLHLLGDPTDDEKHKALESAGWVSGDAEDFLELSEDERKMVAAAATEPDAEFDPPDSAFNMDGWFFVFDKQRRMPIAAFSWMDDAENYTWNCLNDHNEERHTIVQLRVPGRDDKKRAKEIVESAAESMK
jgi:hypothetical protein